MIHDSPHPYPPVPPHSQDRMLEDQRLYLACSDATRPHNGPSVLLGILKVGPKRLFIAKTTGGGIEEMEPCCVLDFYVHETAQRGGWGSLLFNTFLESESRHPARLAYDRPSPKLIAFLAKHHNLRSYARQNNNFVVYDEYWSAEVANFGAVRARNGGRPVTARVGGREGLGAAARKRAEAARRVAAELEQQQKQKSQPGGKMNNFRGMGAPPRPTGSFGYQQQQQQQQPPTRSPAAPPSAETGDSRWTPVSQRPLTAARPSFGRRGVSSHLRRPEDQNQSQNQNYSPPPESSVPGRAYARPPSHGAHSRQYHDDDAGDGGDGIALYNEGVRRDSSAAGDERSRDGDQIGLFRQQRPPPSREYYPSHGRRAGGGVDTPASSYGGGTASPPQPQTAPPLHYPRAPPSASSELAERPGVLQSDRAVRYAQFVRGLRDVDTRAINAVSDAQNARVKRDVENLRVVNGVYQPGARGAIGGVGQNRSHPSGGEANRSQLPAQDTYGYGYRPGNQPGHWRSDDKSNAHNGYRVRRDGFDREGKSAYGSSSESNLNTSPRWGEGLGQARAMARLEHQTKVDARQRWDAARRMREARESGARHVELAGLRGAPRVAQGYPKPPTPGEESRVVRYGRRAMRDMY